jgi:hypothetical protein
MKNAILLISFKNFHNEKLCAGWIVISTTLCHELNHPNFIELERKRLKEKKTLHCFTSTSKHMKT